MASSMSSINILNNSRETTDPCGTTAGQEHFVERAPGSFTCCVRSVRKLWIHSHKTTVDIQLLELVQEDRVINKIERLTKIYKQCMNAFPSV